MAYTQPKYWQHGDGTTAADFNKYSSNLTYFAGALVGVNMACSRFRDENEVPHWFEIQHRSRYLVYAEANDAPRLTNRSRSLSFGLTEVPEGEICNILDLDEIDWLVPGMIYLVRECRYAIETDFI